MPMPQTALFGPARTEQRPCVHVWSAHSWQWQHGASQHRRAPAALATPELWCDMDGVMECQSWYKSNKFSRQQQDVTVSYCISCCVLWSHVMSTYKHGFHSASSYRKRCRCCCCRCCCCCCCSCSCSWQTMRNTKAAYLISWGLH